MILFVGMDGFEFSKDVDQVLGIFEKIIQSINDEFFKHFGGDGFGGAGLFVFGSGADVLTVILAIGLLGGLTIE